MTPTEKKALGKASELIKRFSSTKSTDKTLGRIGWALPKDLAKEFSIEVCDQMLETLNSMKGMGRISKLNFWKKVREYVQES